MVAQIWLAPNRRRLRRVAMLALVTAVAATWVALFWWGPSVIDRTTWRRLTAAERAATAAQFRSMLAQIGLGVGALGALVFTARTFHLSREGQLADRYTRAVEQLGSDKIDVRLGGIFALERIMLDSPRDHDTVIQLLAAFVQEHAALTQQDSATDTPTVQWLLPPTPTQLSRIRNWRPAADIGAALAVLGRRPERPERAALQLSSTDLRGADQLEGARLRRVDLTGADLREVSFRGADMDHGFLIRADLRGAVLLSTNLKRARLEDADLQDAILFSADLGDANLSRAILKHACLEAANLHGANLTGAQLQGTDLQHVAGLTAEQLSHATIDEQTRLPEAVTTIA